MPPEIAALHRFLALKWKDVSGFALILL